MKTLCIIASTLLLYNCQPQDAKLPTILEKGVAEIDHFLQESVDQNKIPAVVAIVANKDNILYHSVFGNKEVASNIEMRKDDLFYMASMTKPITSVAVMILYEEGKLALDDPISKYIPSLRNPEVITQFNETDTTYSVKSAKKEITIQNLLSHTSGFGYDFSNHILFLLKQKTGKDAIDLPLLHEPGSEWTYGMGTRILGELVEKITGSSLDEVFKSRIFEPLGMYDTFYAIPQDKYSRCVSYHIRQNGTLSEQPIPETWQPTILGDYGLFSTASDYITFLQMFLNGGTLFHKKILSEGSIDLMTQNQIGELIVEQQPGANPSVSNAFPLGAGRDKFGLGFQINASNEEKTNLRSPGSYSWAGIMNTHFWVDPQKKIAAVILMQVLPFYDEVCIQVLRGFEERVYRSLN
jgi:CubicO group peptidase (beta-lactamase class C family)